MEQTQPQWRKSSRSGPDNQCIELAYVGLADAGLVRDSKNPHGASLAIDLQPLVQAVKDSRL